MKVTFKKWLAKSLSVVFTIVDNQLISRIPVEEVKIGLRLLMKPILDTVNALCDENPKDSEQILQIWQKFTNGELLDFTDDQLRKLAMKVENPAIQRLLMTLSLPAISILRISTDENPNNAEQIENMIKLFLQSDETHDTILELVGPILSKVLPDGMSALVLGLIAEGLRASTENLSLSRETAVKKIEDEHVKALTTSPLAA